MTDLIERLHELTDDNGFYHEDELRSLMEDAERPERIVDAIEIVHNLYDLDSSHYDKDAMPQVVIGGVKLPAMVSNTGNACCAREPFGFVYVVGDERYFYAKGWAQVCEGCVDQHQGVVWDYR